MKTRIVVLLSAAALLAPAMSGAATSAMKAGVNVPCLEKIVKSDAATPEPK